MTKNKTLTATFREALSMDYDELSRSIGSVIVDFAVNTLVHGKRKINMDSIIADTNRLQANLRKLNDKVAAMKVISRDRAKVLGYELFEIKKEIDKIKVIVKNAKTLLEERVNAVETLRGNMSAYVKKLSGRGMEPRVFEFLQTVTQTRTRLAKLTSSLNTDLTSYVREGKETTYEYIRSETQAIIGTTLDLEGRFKSLTNTPTQSPTYSEDDIIFNSQAAPGSVMVWTGKKNALIGAIIKATAPFTHPTGVVAIPNQRFFIPLNPKITWNTEPGTYQEVKDQIKKNINTIMEQVNG